MQHDITVICIKDESVPWPVIYHKGYQFQNHGMTTPDVCFISYFYYLQDTKQLTGINMCLA